MARSAVRVRDAGPADLDTLLDFASRVLESGDPSSRSPLARLAVGAMEQSQRDRYARLLSDPEHRVLLVVDDQQRTVGAAVVSVDMVSALLTLPVVYVSHFVVPELERDRAVGRALVEAATTFAEEIGAEHVVVGLNPAGRESNRFFARLGFTPLVMRRIASVPTLRRALTDTSARRADVASTGPIPIAPRLARLRRSY